MEINSHFIAAVRSKPSIDVSRCPDAFNVRVNEETVRFERPENMCSFVYRLAKLLKKPVIKR